MLNLLVWAIPRLVLSEDKAGTELHKEHHSRAAGLNQRLAEQDAWDGLIDGACQKKTGRGREENANANQLEEKKELTSGE